MTVKQLIAKLSEFPEDSDVFMDERKTDFRYGLLNSVRIQEINFMEDPDSEVLSTGVVVILDEE